MSHKCQDVPRRKKWTNSRKWCCSPLVPAHGRKMGMETGEAVCFESLQWIPGQSSTHSETLPKTCHNGVNLLDFLRRRQCNAKLADYVLKIKAQVHFIPKKVKRKYIIDSIWTRTGKSEMWEILQDSAKVKQEHRQESARIIDHSYRLCGNIVR